jgi:hypothetical protein
MPQTLGLKTPELSLYDRKPERVRVRVCTPYRIIAVPRMVSVSMARVQKRKWTSAGPERRRAGRLQP